MVSGFMNGIASLIWLREVGSLLGFTPRRSSFDLLIGFERVDRLEGELPWVRGIGAGQNSDRLSKSRWGGRSDSACDDRAQNAFMTALTFGGTLIVPALCRRLLPPAAARKVPSVLIVLVACTLVGLPINRVSTDRNRIQLTDLGGDCESDGGVCYPEAAGGDCGGVECFTFATQESCEAATGGLWTEECAMVVDGVVDGETPCNTILEREACVEEQAGGQWVENTISSFADFASILYRNRPWVDYNANPRIIWTAVGYVWRLVWQKPGPPDRQPCCDLGHIVAAVATQPY
eukprot:SAG11_NODE_1353_length_5128_cov_3.658183_5_plen_291_part_00